MKNYYYMRFNITDAPEEIDCGSIVRMVKEVNEILGCEYERFGYHYDNPDNTNGSPCGKTFRKGKEEAFKKLGLKKYDVVGTIRILRFPRNSCLSLWLHVRSYPMDRAIQ